MKCSIQAQQDTDLENRATEQRIRETKIAIKQLRARGADGVKELLNPTSPFQSFDIKIEWIPDEYFDSAVHAVQEIFTMARRGSPIELCAKDREALLEVIAVAGSKNKKKLNREDLDRFCRNRFERSMRWLTSLP